MTATGRPPTRPAGAFVLAAGIVALEFAAAVTRFVSSTLLPLVVHDLGARGQLALLVAGSTLGLFVALPLASRVLAVLGTRGALAVGVVAYVGGLILSATAGHAWVFALGQFCGGLASGLLAVFGVSAAIRHLDEGLRVRVVAASSAMWIVPALVGPAATLGLEHLVGWRWTLLVPVPVVLIGRLLVVRASGADLPDEGAHRPLGRTLLVPLGVAVLVFGTGRGWPLAVAGVVVALVGVVAIMPRGTFRLARGTPAALGALTLFAVGYFGADSFITVLLTDGYHTSLAKAAIVLGAAPLAWAVTSLVVPRRGIERFPAPGLGLTCVGVAVLAGTLLFAPSFGVALGAWTAAGIGVGLAYPGLYIRATSVGAHGFSPAALATAAITAEAFGGMLGGALGGVISSASLVVSYLMFAVFLAAASIAAGRTTG